MLREDSSEISKDAADRLRPGIELKPLDNSQKYRIALQLLVFIWKHSDNFFASKFQSFYGVALLNI